MNITHKESEILHDEYIAFQGRLGNEAFQVVVKEKGTKVFNRVVGVQKANEALRSDRNESCRIYCNFYDSNAIKNCLSLKRTSKDMKILNEYFWGDQIEERNDVIQWINNNNVDFVCAVLSFDSSKDISQQRMKANRFIQMLSELHGDVRYKICFELEGQTRNHQREKQLEELIINSSILLYTSGVNIVYLSLQIDSISEDLREKWTILERENKKNNKTYRSLITLRDGSTKFSIDIAKKFLSSFPHEECQLQLPSGVYGKFQYQNLQKIIMEVVNKVNFQCIFFVKTNKLTMEVLPSDVEKILKTCTHFSNVDELYFYFKNSSYQNRKCTNEEKQNLFRILTNNLPNFKKVAKVFINNKDIKDISGGKEIYERFLKSRQGSFLADLIKNRKEGRYNRSKVMILGDGEAGKTSLIRSFLGEAFVETHEKTIVAVNTDIVDINMKGWKKMEDTQVSSSFARDLSYVSSSVVKHQNQEQTNTEQQQLNFKKRPTKLFRDVLPIIEAASKSSDVKVVRVNAPSGNPQRERVYQQLVAALRNTENPMKLSVWDFGGQKVFNALHPLYLSAEGIYFIVFNAEKLALNLKPEMEKLRYWLISVSLYCNKGHVFFIGTRAEATVFQEQGFGKINTEIDKMLVHFSEERIVYNEKDDLWFFPVENSLGDKNDVFLAPIRQELNTLLTDDSVGKRTWNTKIQLSWMFFMHNVFEENQNVLSLEEVKKKALSIGFSEDETKDMVTFFGKAGTILNFSDKMPADQLSIVMRPEWLLKVLAVFVCSREDSKRLKKMKKLHDGSRRLIPLLEEEGIVSTTILRNLLEVRKDELNFIIKICEEMLIMSKLVRLPSPFKMPISFLQKNDFWIVPFFHVKEKRLISETKFQKSKREGNEQELHFARKEILWGEKVPKALFERFICSVVNHANSNRSFRVQSIDGSVLVAELENKRFEVEFKAENRYFLNIYSADISHIEHVCYFVREAYKELCSSGLSADITAECYFYSHQVQTEEDAVVDDKKWDCFLSHSWGKNQLTHKRVLGIAEKLKERGLRVWVDAEQLTDTVEQQILAGIEGSHVFVAFVTQKYLDSSNDQNNNAGQEFRYAASKDVNLIAPVVMETGLLNPQTWNNSVLKLKLATKLYIDFSSPAKETANLEYLVKRIRELKALSMN